MTGSSKNDHRLESYLTSLERALRPFSVSDRSEIITEIKSHILDALDRDPQTSLDSVLSALGEPETVANKYLMERGMKPAKPPISPVVKWIVIGMLGMFAMILAFTGFLISHFSSVVDIDAKNERVSVLGGMIKVDGKRGTVNVDTYDGSNGSFNGSTSIPKSRQIKVKFSNGKLELRNASDENFTWSCEGIGSGAPQQLASESDFTLDISPLTGARCELSIPAKAKLALDGANGKIDLEKPKYSVQATMANGAVSIDEDDSTKYKYDLDVKSGKIDRFDSSDKPDALSISVHIVNGKISRD